MHKILLSSLIVLILPACGSGGGEEGGGSGNPPPAQNSAPVANAGTDITQDISPSPLALDASGSTDPDNDQLTYDWTVVSQPAGAAIALNDVAIASPEFESLVPGEYEFQLTVTDPGGLTSSDTVLVTLINQAPTISVAGVNRNPGIGEDVQLDASASADPNGHSLTYAWEVTQAPAESGMPLSYNGAIQTLQFDVPGEYVLQLEVSDGFDPATEVWDPVDVVVFDVVLLSNGFADAEFDAAAKRIVTILDRTLAVIESDGSENEITLPTAATAVSLAPDGTTAAVAHDGWVSHVDLNSMSVLATHNVPANLGDIVLDGQGYAYGFPATGQWVNMVVLDTATGAVQSSTGLSIRERTLAKLHPSGNKIYGADNGLSPSDLERYSIGGGTASIAYDSPYHGDYPFCGDLWYGIDGDTILSRCRVVVRATDNQASDLTFAMQLDNQSNAIAHASSSAFERSWHVIDREFSNGGSRVKAYDVDSGSLVDTWELPFIDDSQTQRWIGWFVFSDNDSSTIRVLAVDDDANPQNYALLQRLDPSISGTNRPPMAVARRYHTSRVSETVTLDGSASVDPEGQSLTYQWTLTSEPAGSSLQPGDLTAATLSFTPSIAGSYDFELVVNDGVRESPATKVIVNVFETNASLVHRLEDQVADAEFSKSLNSLVYVNSTDNNLHILNVSDFSETIVELSQQAFTVGISPDGLFAAVSHPGMASLVDLTSATVTDTQTYTEDWGDIVLDQNHRAHLVPNRDQWSYLVSLDFAADLSDSVYGARAGTQVRMHPVSGWVYGADRGLSPSDFEKWDVSSFPSVSLGDSPYHGDYSIAGNIWISEDGDRLVVAGGSTFNSSSDPTVDMTYSGSLADSVFAGWADHSSERDEWVIATAARIFSSDPLDNKLIFYDDTFFNQIEVQDFEAIPTSDQPVATTGSRSFFSDDGSKVIVLLEGEGLLDQFAVQVSDR